MTEQSEIRQWYVAHFGEPQNETQQTMLQVVVEAIQKWEERQAGQVTR